jgi:predicted dienelactone hydrolase
MGTAPVGSGVAGATSLSGGLAFAPEHASSVNPHTAPTRPAAVASVMVAALTVTVLGCGQAGPQVTRVQARPVAPTLTISAGEHALGMGTLRLRDAATRDGRLYVPRQAAPQRPLPLIVLLHGGGGRAQDFRSTFPLAEEFGVVMLALDSRHNTWDGIDSPFGPDVQFIDAALRYTFERVASANSLLSRTVSGPTRMLRRADRRRR